MKARAVSVFSVWWSLLPAFLVGGAFASVGIVHVSSRVLVVRTGYQLSELEAEHRAQLRENDRLKLELATLKSPARLEKLAVELGMAPPSSRDVVTLVPSPRLGRAAHREVRPDSPANLARAEAIR
jgi:cell division protein FtsL